MDEYAIELLKKADRETAEQITKLAEQLTPGSPAVSDKYIQEVISNPTTQVWVVRDGRGKIVGMATLVIIMKLQGPRKAVIEDVVVDESTRGRGLGKKLIHKVLEMAKKSEVKSVFLTSRPARTAANKMYQSLGFIEYETNNYKYDL